MDIHLMQSFITGVFGWYLINWCCINLEVNSQLRKEKFNFLKYSFFFTCLLYMSRNISCNNLCFHI